MSWIQYQASFVPREGWVIHNTISSYSSHPGPMGILFVCIMKGAVSGKSSASRSPGPVVPEWQGKAQLNLTREKSFLSPASQDEIGLAIRAHEYHQITLFRKQ